MTVPERLRFRPLGVELLDRVEDLVRLRADEGVPAVLEGLDPLRLVAQRDAGHTEEIGLLLDPAAVGNHLRGSHEEGDEVQVVDWLDRFYLRLQAVHRSNATRFLRVRGWTGNTTGLPAWTRASTIADSVSWSSTFCGRWRVTRRYSPRVRPSRERMSRERAACALCSATSYITSPTMCTPRVMPSRVRFSTAVSVGANNRLDR